MELSARKRRRTTNLPYITPRSYNRRFDNRDGTPSLDPSSTSRVRFPNSQRFSTTRPLLPQSSISNVVYDEIMQQSIDDDFGQVIVAIDMRDSGTVGCSYYSAQEETLYLMGDVRFAGNETIDSLILQTKPTLLLASARVDYLTSRRQNSGQEDEMQTYLPYQLDIRPSQEFSGPSAKSKLTALKLFATHEQLMQFLVP